MLRNHLLLLRRKGDEIASYFQALTDQKSSRVVVIFGDKFRREISFIGLNFRWWVEVLTLNFVNIFLAGRLFHTMSATNNKPFTVFVEGNIGSGKTTFLEHFRRFEDITLLTEPVEEWRNLKGWNLLDLMYKDPTKWAMTFQTYVTLTMLDMHRRPTATPVKLMERSLYSAKYCFVEHMRRCGTIHPAQFAVLDEWFRFIDAQIPIQADLIVYLKTTPSIVHERIKKRARSEEQCVPLEYIEQLHTLHEDWLLNRTHAECPAPVLVLDADLDLSQITEEYKRSEHQILRKAVDVVMRSPNKMSPKKPVSTTPIKITPQLSL